MNTKKQQSRQQEVQQLMEDAAKALTVKEVLDEHHNLVKKLVNELPDEFFIEVEYRNDFRL